MIVFYILFKNIQIMEGGESKKAFKITMVLILVLIFSFVFWDTISHIIPYQLSSSTWSSSSEISFSTWSSTNSDTNYINAWDNSSIIWNYFNWYYYDSVLGFFKLNWSSDKSKNVHISNSTSRCSSGYWYKFSWYAYSTYYGFINFAYSNSIFVYYCESDKKLHWYAYSEHNWFQNFEDIWFNIVPAVWGTIVNNSSSLFVNDITEIDNEDSFSWSSSNYDHETIGWDRINIEDTDESIFYIIK